MGASLAFPHGLCEQRASFWGGLDVALATLPRYPLVMERNWEPAYPVLDKASYRSLALSQGVNHFKCYYILQPGWQIASSSNATRTVG